MFSHFTLGSNDLIRSREFYTPVMDVLNQTLIETAPERGYLMYGPTNRSGDHPHPHLFISRPFDGLPATWSNGFHIAFNAPEKGAVERFYEVALSAGGSDEGTPGLRSHYAEDYYAAYVRDPDGNKLQAVCYLNGRRCGGIGDVISHITIGHGNLARDRLFYLACLAALGYVEIPEEGDFDSAGFGIADCELPVVYIQPTYDGRATTWGNGVHSAFIAPSRQAVSDFHRAALDSGGSCDGPPGLRPHYSEHYYAAYVRDPSGNKLQAVCRQRE